mmetsp:Transcript_12137/g.28335  ORF Transcript_12137/g.28335 Transcript_12137/m.28335 type:complete len:323 (-) Transcript_12137:185-1153(-)
MPSKLETPMEWARRHLPGHNNAPPGAVQAQPGQPPVAPAHHGMHMPHMHMPHLPGHHAGVDVSGTYATNIGDGHLITVCQTGQSLRATSPHSDWKAATGILSGPTVTMNFPGFPPVNGTVAHGRISWENGVEWTLQNFIDLTGTYTTNRDDGHVITIMQEGTSITATSPQESWSPATGSIKGRNVSMTFPGFAKVHGAWLNGTITWSGDATGVVWDLMDGAQIASINSAGSQMTLPFDSSVGPDGKFPSYGSVVSTFEVPDSSARHDGPFPQSTMIMPTTTQVMSSQISMDTFVPSPSHSAQAAVPPPAAAAPAGQRKRIVV